MKKKPTDTQIPIAMAPPERGTCDRCETWHDTIWPVYYQRTDPRKDNSRNLCTSCREDCGYGTKWKYAGGGDVVAIPPGKRTA